MEKNTLSSLDVRLIGMKRARCWYTRSPRSMISISNLFLILPLVFYIVHKFLLALFICQTERKRGVFNLRKSMLTLVLPIISHAGYTQTYLIRLPYDLSRVKHDKMIYLPYLFSRGIGFSRSRAMSDFDPRTFSGALVRECPRGKSSTADLLARGDPPL